MKQKLAFVINSLGSGGAEKVISILTKYLSDYYEVDLVVLDDLEIHNDIHESVNLVILNDSSFVAKISSFFRYLKTKNPPIVISFLYRSSYFNVLSKIFFKHHAIISDRTTPSVHFAHGIYGLLNKLAIRISYKFSDRIIAVSAGVQKDLKENFNIAASRICIIYNPFEFELIRKRAAESNYFEGVDYIVTVGRLTYVKGYDKLIRAYSKSNLSYQLIITGEGEEKEPLLQLIKKEKLGEKVHLAGYQKNPYKYIAKAKYYVLTSLQEGFPNAMVEAMCLGKAVIAVNCKSGPAEILSPAAEISNHCVNYCEFGIIVPIDREDLLIEALEELEKNIDLRRKYEEKSLLRSKDFSVAAIVDQYKSLLTGLEK